MTSSVESTSEPSIATEPVRQPGPKLDGNQDDRHRHRRVGGETSSACCPRSRSEKSSRKEVPPFASHSSPDDRPSGRADGSRDVARTRPARATREIRTRNPGAAPCERRTWPPSSRPRSSSVNRPSMRLRLPRRPGTDLAAPAARAEIGVRLFVGDPAHRTAHPDLTAEARPVETQRSVGICGEFPALATAEIGVEHESRRPRRASAAPCGPTGMPSRRRSPAPWRSDRPGSLLAASSNHALKCVDRIVKPLDGHCYCRRSGARFSEIFQPLVRHRHKIATLPD